MKRSFIAIALIMVISITACDRSVIVVTPTQFIATPEITETVGIPTAQPTNIVYPIFITVTPSRSVDCRNILPNTICSIDIRLAPCMIANTTYQLWPYQLLVTFNPDGFSACMGVTK